MKEIVNISGPFSSYGEAREVWETVYYGEDGPYWIDEPSKNVFYIVTHADVEEND